MIIYLFKAGKPIFIQKFSLERKRVESILEIVFTELDSNQEKGIYNAKFEVKAKAKEVLYFIDNPVELNNERKSFEISRNKAKLTKNNDGFLSSIGTYQYDNGLDFTTTYGLTNTGKYPVSSKDVVDSESSNSDEEEKSKNNIGFKENKDKTNLPVSNISNLTEVKKPNLFFESNNSITNNIAIQNTSQVGVNILEMDFLFANNNNLDLFETKANNNNSDFIVDFDFTKK